MPEPDLRTVTLDSKTLDGAIDVLASAADQFRLSSRERSVYRLLMISTDTAIASFMLLFAALFALLLREEHIAASFGRENMFLVIGVVGILLALSALCALIALLLNIPLLRRTAAEEAAFRRLGVTALSRSLWKASRRRQWLSRLRGALLVVFGVLSGVLAAIYLLMLGELDEAVPAAAVAALFALLLFVARYLRNRREQIDLATNAEELRQALHSLREHAGTAGSVAVPAELVERAAAIESANIARARRDAILQSADDRSSGCAIAFDADAARQRSALPAPDRIELEDLLAQLGTREDLLTAAAGERADGRSTATTESGRVAIEYGVDRAARAIRIKAVKPAAQAASSAGAAAGGSHG